MTRAFRAALLLAAAVLLAGCSSSTGAGADGAPERPAGPTPRASVGSPLGLGTPASAASASAASSEAADRDASRDVERTDASASAREPKETSVDEAGQPGRDTDVVQKDSGGPPTAAEQAPPAPSLIGAPLDAASGIAADRGLQLTWLVSDGGNPRRPGCRVVDQSPTPGAPASQSRMDVLIACP